MPGLAVGMFLGVLGCAVAGGWSGAGGARRKGLGLVWTQVFAARRPRDVLPDQLGLESGIYRADNQQRDVLVTRAPANFWLSWMTREWMASGVSPGCLATRTRSTAAMCSAGRMPPEIDMASA